MNKLQELQAFVDEWRGELKRIESGAQYGACHPKLFTQLDIIQAALDECETIIAADNGKQKHESAMSWWHYEGQKDSAEHVVDAMHKAMEASNEV